MRERRNTLSRTFAEEERTKMRGFQVVSNRRKWWLKAPNWVFTSELNSVGPLENETINNKSRVNLSRFIFLIRGYGAKNVVEVSFDGIWWVASNAAISTIKKNYDNDVCKAWEALTNQKDQFNHFQGVSFSRDFDRRRSRWGSKLRHGTWLRC